MSNLKPLLDNIEQFDFFQAIRLLAQQGLSNYKFIATQAMKPTLGPLARGQVNSRHTEGDYSFEILSNVFCLTGATGVLPYFYTEKLRRNDQLNDRALRDFFDIFNNRLHNLLFQAWQRYRSYIQLELVQYKQTKVDCIETLLQAFVGLLANSSCAAKVTDPSLFIHFAGCFAQQRRSAMQLTAMLNTAFNTNITINHYQGLWYPLSTTERSRLGGSNHYNQLGNNVVIGNYVRHIQTQFRIRIGPVPYELYQKFLPNQEYNVILRELVDYYVGVDYSYDIQLIVIADSIPKLHLTKERAPRLGYDTWLANLAFQHNDDQAIFNT